MLGGEYEILAFVLGMVLGKFNLTDLNVSLVFGLKF